MKALGMAAAAILVLSGCGSGSRGQGASTSSRTPSDGDDFSLPGVSVSGGSASGGTGGDGGSFTVRCQGAVRSATDRPPGPDLPQTAPVHTVDDLSQDLVFSGTTAVVGTVVSTGASPTRSISVNDGDLIVSGSLLSADLGARAQGLSLTASGTIVVSGSVKADGLAGGSVTLRASRLVITGTVSAGARAGSGGAGGTITLEATGAINLSNGGLSCAGSDGLHGGAGGTIAIRSPSEIVVNTVLRVRGGSGRTAGAGASGGDGGTVRIDGYSSVRLAGTVDGGGGSGEQAGRGGRVEIGVADPVASLSLQEAGVGANGGDGSLGGGHGGTIDFLSSTGGFVLSGTFSAEGGASGVRGGDGGRILVLADRFGGDLQSGATMLASGGSALASSTSAAGGAGGRVELFAWFDPSRSSAGTGGSIVLAASSVIAAGGGDATGPAAAGAGGLVHLEIPEASVSIAGTISVRGGAAAGSGAGGRGGFVWVDSDSNNTASGGALTLEAGGVIDASGGPSASGRGGDARWSSTPGAFDPNSIPIAVLLDADSNQGGPNPGGFIRNAGTVIARGGAPNGHGGDVEFHGLGDATDPVTGEINPARGDVRNDGDGSGGNGVFTSD